ncbi:MULTISPECIES: hypothetical protein [Nocardia]|uniref:DUF4403 family protein n=1 Tax=Nocardia sputorum TaxID=2984338 RepID=A0ABN6TXY7_9NOCA|nr:hypothetical protein [Nocardia sputorum]BDT95990.1 hypothetical protein IFM12275_59660 [Nocardia sputorum]BDT97750.1 hypothetical protein IFM12276_07790 [Nocardia sputorum]
MHPTDESSSAPAWIDYAEFGERFVTHAVNAARIESAVSGMTGRGLTIGPVSIGPAGLAGFVAEGKVGAPRVLHSGPRVTYEVTVPVSLTLKVLLGGRKLRLEARVEIDLTLHARTAEPVLIIIDIPPITQRDISFVLRAQAVESAWEWLLDPIAGVVQREVASRVNAMLADPQTRRGLVFDVEAMVAGKRSAYRDKSAFDWIGYDEFGHRFFSRIVTRERVHDVVERLAGRPIEVGPLRTGPRASAVVTVRGAVRMPRLTDRSADPVAFDLTLPVSLDITVAVLKANYYRADVEVPLVLTARAADPLRVVIDVPPPDPADIRMEFTAHGARAAALGALAGIKKQVIAQVAAVIRKELADPAMRTIDVAARIDGIA